MMHAHFTTGRQLQGPAVRCRGAKHRGQFRRSLPRAREFVDPNRQKTTRKFYDGLVFRVIASFMIQGAIRWQTHGGPGLSATSSTRTASRQTGILSMANSGPTQRQPVLHHARADAWLTTSTACSAKSSRVDIIQKIGKTQTGAQDRPVKPIALRR
jgi:cyclophilin family peptidyl-prolyl cis-trans isomerase